MSQSPKTTRISPSKASSLKPMCTLCTESEVTETGLKKRISDRGVTGPERAPLANESTADDAVTKLFILKIIEIPSSWVTQFSREENTLHILHLDYIEAETIQHTHWSQYEALSSAGEESMLLGANRPSSRRRPSSGTYASRQRDKNTTPFCGTPVTVDEERGLRRIQILLQTTPTGRVRSDMQ